MMTETRTAPESSRLSALSENHVFHALYIDASSSPGRLPAGVLRIVQSWRGGDKLARSSAAAAAMQLSAMHNEVHVPADGADEMIAFVHCVFALSRRSMVRREPHLEQVLCSAETRLLGPGP
jgi:hypothetical protein